MKNWLKICKFTLKQAIRGAKFIPSTIIVGLVIFAAVIVSNFLLSGAIDNDSPMEELEKVYIVNETKLDIDTDSFVSKNQSKYPNLDITVTSDKSAEEIASDSDATLVMKIAEDEDGTRLVVYIPKESSVGNGDADDFAEAFSKSISDAKISSIGISEDEFDMAVSDLNITELEAENSEDEQDLSLFAYMAPLAVMMILYFLVIFYGQSIGQVVSIEKTSKLMEYILTLTGPSGIIFGKVTAAFLEALIQLCVWIICGACGLVISDIAIKGIIGENDKNIIALFMEAMPEGGVSGNFIVLVILAVIALLVAFLFYCFVSAMFASFAATAEELSQTNSMSLMTMLAGFLVSMYVPLFTDNSKVGMTIIRIIPFTAAFCLPGDVISARIGIVEYVLYLALLIFFTVMLAILIGRVYKNRLFKKGTKGIFAEIVSAITGKESSAEDQTNRQDGTSVKEKALSVNDFANYDKAKKAYTVIGFGLLIFILAANSLGGSIGNVIANIVAANGHKDILDIYESITFLTITNIVGSYLIAFPLFVLVSRFANDSVSKIKGNITKGQYLRALCIIFPVDIGLGYLSNMLASVISGGQANNDLIEGLLTGESILTIIMVAVLAPIFEELIFRKIIIDRTRKYGEVVAIVYSALAFGIFHCNLYQIFYAFALGLIFGYVYIKTGNVVLTIIMHMAINGTSSIFYPLAPEAYKVFIIVMCVLGVVSIIYTLIKRDVRIERAENEVSSKELTKVALLNSGSILFAIVCALIAAYVLFNSTLG